MPLVLSYAKSSLSEQSMYYLRRMLLINIYYVMMTEYMEKATLQLTSLPKAGRDSRTKSENSSLFRTNMYFTFKSAVYR